MQYGRCFQQCKCNGSQQESLNQSQKGGKGEEKPTQKETPNKPNQLWIQRATAAKFLHREWSEVWIARRPCRGFLDPSVPKATVGILPPVWQREASKMDQPMGPEAQNVLTAQGGREQQPCC